MKNAAKTDNEHLIEPTTEPTKTEAKLLEQYAMELNTLHGEIQSNDALSVKHGKISLLKAVRAGKILLDAQERLVPYGEWMTWCKTNIPAYTIRHIQRFQKIADTTYMSLVNGCNSISEALRAIKEREAQKKGDKPKEPTIGSPSQPDTATPEQTKQTNAAKYGALIDEAKREIHQRIVNELERSKVNWDIEDWSVKNGKPCSTDTSGLLYSFLVHLSELATSRIHSSITSTDEALIWNETILVELLKHIRREMFPVNLETMRFVHIMDVGAPVINRFDVPLLPETVTTTE